jgi:hypothetical protein
LFTAVVLVSIALLDGLNRSSAPLDSQIDLELKRWELPSATDTSVASLPNIRHFAKNAAGNPRVTSLFSTRCK